LERFGNEKVRASRNVRRILSPTFLPSTPLLMREIFVERRSFFKGTADNLLILGGKFAGGNTEHSSILTH